MGSLVAECQSLSPCVALLTRGIVEAIKAGMFHASMKAELDPLEARKQELTDLLPSMSSIYARKVAQLRSGAPT